MSELKRYDVDIHVLSETRLAREDSMEEVGIYTLFWRGLQEDSPRMNGGRLRNKYSLLRYLLENLAGTNERLMTLRTALTKKRHYTQYLLKKPLRHSILISAMLSSSFPEKTN